MTRFIYDNEDILLELDGSNNIVARYTHGPGIDEPLVMEKAGASFFVLNTRSLFLTRQKVRAFSSLE